MTKEKLPDNQSAKDALTRAACDLFARKGYAAVSTREVAEAAGVNLGSIQYYFGSKARLFIETTCSLIRRTGHEVEQRFQVEDCSGCKVEAAERFGLIVHSFLEYLLVAPEGPQPCRMMFRELLSETGEDPEMREALVSTITEEFVRPMEKDLERLLTILAPDLNDTERLAAVRSVLGQCLFYMTHRPFQERLMGVRLDDPEVIAQLAKHIVRFSLTALHGDEQLIAKALERRTVTESSSKEKGP